MDAYIEFAKLVIVAAISGVLSFLLSIRAFRKQKWWEKRVEAYQRVIEALSDLRHYYSVHFDLAITNRDLTKRNENELKKYHDNAFRDIRRYANSGVFFLSPKANASLVDFLKEEHVDTWFDHCDSQLAKLTLCLNTLQDCARHELKL